MSTIFGQDKPHRWPKKAYFSCAIGVYFMSFFMNTLYDFSFYFVVSHFIVPLRGWEDLKCLIAIKLIKSGSLVQICLHYTIETFHLLERTFKISEHILERK